MDLTWGRVGRRNGAKSSGSGGPSSSGGGHRLALRSNQNGGARNGTNGAAEHQAGPRQSGASDSPQNGSSQKTYKISASDIQMVQNLIERCLQVRNSVSPQVSFSAVLGRERGATQGDPDDV